MSYQLPFLDFFLEAIVVFLPCASAKHDILLTALELSRDTITHALGQTLLRARQGLGGSQNQAEA